MSKNRLTTCVVIVLMVGAVAVYAARPSGAWITRAVTWQRMASPGPLSTAHVFLADNCAACHTAVKGIEASNCIMCHANNDWLLKRQPTAFHENVGSCRECHPEHQGGMRPPATMDHIALVRIGLRTLEAEITSDSEGARRQQQNVEWLRQLADGGGSAAANPHITALEATLKCAACHGTKDRHFGLFGKDCAQCHATTLWTIPEFRHPSPQSTDCAQCHQAPPSHYMEHFQMVSAKVACQPKAKVNQCYLCHQTTSWNDIKGVGWYKHH